MLGDGAGQGILNWDHGSRNCPGLKPVKDICRTRAGHDRAPWHHPARRFVAEGPRLSLYGNFHLSKLSGRSMWRQTGVQFFRKDQRIRAIRIIAWNGFDHIICVLLVKRDCRRIVDRGFEINNTAGERDKTLLSSLQQRRPDPVFACVGEDINRDDVANPLTGDVHNQKADNLRRGILRNQCNGAPPAYVDSEFVPAVRGSRGKTQLVDFPKPLKIPR